MKTFISMESGNATLKVYAENAGEDSKVLSVARYAESIGARADMGKKSYKRQFYKPCPHCDQQVKGATGMARHIGYKHKDKMTATKETAAE